MNWDPFEEMRKIRNEIDAMFARFFGRPEVREAELTIPQGFREPLSDIFETDNEIVIVTELPGVNKDDIKISASEDSIEIKAEVREEKVKRENYFSQERRYKGFYRSLSLPVKVDPTKAKATYKNGLLEIRLPKKEAARKINVKVE